MQTIMQRNIRGNKKNVQERYDPSKPVCDNQDDFNIAFRKAIKDAEEVNLKEGKPWIVMFSIFWLIFLVWGIMLAMKVPQGPERVEHLVFAMAFGPVYVIANYLGKNQM
jgi:hypothetical protein